MKTEVCLNFYVEFCNVFITMQCYQVAHFWFEASDGNPCSFSLKYEYEGLYLQNLRYKFDMTIFTACC